MNKKVEVIEVGPRDGFQSIEEYIPIEKKMEIIEGLIKSGVKHIEYTSFVSPKAIPQFIDRGELTKRLLQRYPDLDFFPLVANFYDARAAYELGIRRVSFETSLSESYSKDNLARTHEESFDKLKKIQENYGDLKICVSIATIFGCPFEGRFSIKEMIGFIAKLLNMGIKEITLADTIGCSNPRQVREIVKAVKEAFPEIEFQVHFHDTRNMGMVNALAAIEAGITKVQSTLGGLGDCPFAPGASGNTATEDLVYMLGEMGYDTGIDIVRLLKTARDEKNIIDGNFSGHLVSIGSE